MFMHGNFILIASHFFLYLFFYFLNQMSLLLTFLMSHFLQLFKLMHQFILIEYFK